MLSMWIPIFLHHNNHMWAYKRTQIRITIFIITMVVTAMVIFTTIVTISVIIMAGTDFVGYRILATDMENIIDETCSSCVAESKTVPVVMANDTRWTILNNTATGLETRFSCAKYWMIKSWTLSDTR